MIKVNIVKEFKGGSMARTFLIKKNGDFFVRKVVENNIPLGKEKLKDQWEWQYKFSQQIPNIFPKVSMFVVGKDYSYYDMEYIKLPTLRDIVIEEKGYDTASIRSYLYYGSIIAQPLNIDGPKTDSYVMDKHLRKMQQRCESVKHFNIYNEPYIYINGKKYKNVSKIIGEIEQDTELLEFLRPKKWYRSHGDFTLQNVLTDNYDIRVIDPRGEDKDSIYYDLSKIFQSVHGKYDLIYDGNYEVWGSYDSNLVSYNIIENEELFNDLYETIKKLIPQYYKLEDENWETITKFYEASHFISMFPFRFIENKGTDILCYAIGVEILNEFMEEYYETKRH